MKKQTKLLKFILNPSFLESIKQPDSSVEISGFISLNIMRNNKKIHITFYSGEEGQVNISSIGKYGMIGNTIIKDYCQSHQDFINLMQKLDDLLKRIPTYDS